MLVIKSIVASTEKIFKIVKSIGKQVDQSIQTIAYIPEAGKWFGKDLANFLELPLVNADKCVSGKGVLLVDCICDSGRTLKEYIKRLRPQQTAVFISRDRKDKIIDADIIGIVYYGDEFLVGYGLDYNNKYRVFKCIFAADLTEGESFYTRK